MTTEAIIRENGYTAVWTKEPTGDKPWRQAIVSDSLKELREIAQEHGGEVHFLRRRNGERTYEDKGVLRASNLTEITYPDYYIGIKTVWEEAEADIERLFLKGYCSWGEWLSEQYPMEDLDRSIAVLQRKLALMDQVLAAVDPHDVTLVVIDEVDNVVEFATTEDCTSYSFDVWEFQLGVIIPSEA
jgi:hypothetical protein